MDTPLAPLVPLDAQFWRAARMMNSFPFKQRKKLDMLGRHLIQAMCRDESEVDVTIMEGKLKSMIVQKPNMKIRHKLTYMFSVLGREQRKTYIEAMQFVMVSMLGGNYDYTFFIRRHNIYSHKRKELYFYTPQAPR